MAADSEPPAENGAPAEQRGDAPTDTNPGVANSETPAGDVAAANTGDRGQPSKKRANAGRAERKYVEHAPSRRRKPHANEADSP